MSGERIRKLFSVVALAAVVSVADAPTEFRIFSAGLNTSTKGTALFDEQAAADVMAAYAAHGVEVAIDLEHLSAQNPSTCVSFDPDARGYCKLEVRNGELWAVDVRWTQDGSARLSEGRQRYISPLFLRDKQSGRVQELLNVALVAQPATDNIEPLIAASRWSDTSQGDQAMTPEQLTQLAQLLGLGPDAKVEDVIATAAAMVKKIQDAANGSGSAAEDQAAPPPEAASNAPPVVAASRLRVATLALSSLTGAKDLSASLETVTAWRASHLELDRQRIQLATERTTLESTERRRLVGELVTLGAETPATAWAANASGVPDGATPVARLANEPMADLRVRVTQLSAGRTGLRLPPRPPAGGGGGNEDAGQTVTVRGETVALSAREVQRCKDMGADIEVYASNKIAHERAAGSRS